MDESHVEGTEEQRVRSDRRVVNNGNVEGNRRYIDRREEKTPELLPTAWPFPSDIAKPSARQFSYPRFAKTAGDCGGVAVTP